MMQIEKIENKDLKADIVQEILYDLPEWFGLPESTQAYIDEARELDLWLAMDELGERLGFITLSSSSQDCGEIHCMGVKLLYHRKGIGKALLASLEKFAQAQYSLLQVKTVDEGHYESYD